MSCQTTCENKPFVALSPRVIGARIEVETTTSTRLVVPADVTTIAYTVTNETTEAPITSGTLTPIASYIFDPARIGDKFGDDLPDWNFEHRAPGTFFPLTAIDETVRITYEFKDSGGNLIGAPHCVERVVAECLDC